MNAHEPRPSSSRLHRSSALLIVYLHACCAQVTAIHAYDPWPYNWHMACARCICLLALCLKLIAHAVCVCVCMCLCMCRSVFVVRRATTGCTCLLALCLRACSCCRTDTDAVPPAAAPLSPAPPSEAHRPGWGWVCLYVPVCVCDFVSSSYQKKILKKNKKSLSKRNFVQNINFICY